MTTKQLTPNAALVALIRTMEADNGCSFSCTIAQQRAGSAAIAVMQDIGGAVFPDDPEVFHDIDGIYWELAAGEESEREAKYGRVPGYPALNKVLNDIFENP